jgi:hypothetical protein
VGGGQDCGGGSSLLDHQARGCARVDNDESTGRGGGANYDGERAGWGEGGTRRSVAERRQRKDERRGVGGLRRVEAGGG